MTDESAAQGRACFLQSTGTLIFPHQKCMNGHALALCTASAEVAATSTGPSFDLAQVRAMLKF
jgi:hypothetical protein